MKEYNVKILVINNIPNLTKKNNIEADDYLTKPFNLSELNARIKAVIRRKTHQFSQVLDFDSLSIDVGERKVIAHETEL